MIDLELDSIAHGGEAIGRYHGKAIFVPYAIPGERVRAEIVEEKERWARARLVEVLMPSPDRVEAPCPYFGPDRCSGCQWQHIAYERQAELKQEIVADQLRRLAHIQNPPVADIFALANPDAETQALDYEYRNQVHFSVTAAGQLGFRRAGGQDVIPIDRCLLLSARLDEFYAGLDLEWPELSGLSLRAGYTTGEGLIVFQTQGEEQPELEIDLPAACALQTARGLQPLIGEPYIREVVNDQLYRISAESYFPSHILGAAALGDMVARYAEPESTDTLVDVYCGVGVYSLPLAHEVAQVIAIDSSPAACEDFAANAGDRESVTLHEGAVEQVLPILLEQGQAADIVVLDPPRAGAGREVLRMVAGLGPRRVIYFASDPASLARDAEHLSAAGYRLTAAQPVDLSPQTYYVETVALWERL
jgi:tRNA/tmRNA/rRNA uracil-C5-methylase (TrmA/RlmC/RlmD family)